MTELVLDDRTRSAKGTATLCYLLYGISALGLFVSWLPFVGLISLTGIAAIIINYVRDDEAHGTVVESHFRWQKRTFWFGLLWNVLGGVLFVTLIGVPLALGIWFAVGVWLVYRVIKGWTRLNNLRPAY
ncbi:MAG TPA: hypothetical protein VFS42_01455 [Burkholderiaceae bacterium]|nr:hypothetical protein [Burkholderiaceae bacterium]